MRSFLVSSFYFVETEKTGGKGFLAAFVGIVTFLMSLFSLLTYFFWSVFNSDVVTFAEAFVFGRVLAALVSERG